VIMEINRKDRRVVIDITRLVFYMLRVTEFTVDTTNTYSY
jgi:hypothetical protein